jgi:hypothetical protein
MNKIKELCNLAGILFGLVTVTETVDGVKDQSVGVLDELIELGVIVTVSVVVVIVGMDIPAQNLDQVVFKLGIGDYVRALS